MTDRADRLHPVVEDVLAALPDLRPGYEQTVRECAQAGLADDADEVFLDELTRELLRRYPEDPARLGALAAAFEVAVDADPAVTSVVESVFLVVFPDPAPDSAPDRAPGPGGDPTDVLGPTLAAVLRARRQWKPEPANVAFVGRLVAAVPDLAPVARENGADDGELLVHLFLADVARQVVAAVVAGRAETVRPVVAAIEAEFGHDPVVDEPIAVSFVEHLPYPGEPGATEVVALLGPALRAELARQRAEH